MRRLLLALVLLAGLAGTARADTNYYVAATGSDSNPCSLSQPCLTIAHVQTVVQAYIAALQPLYHFIITPTANSNNDLLYDLSLAPAGFWTHVRSDGGDIRVTKQDGTTQVPREVSAFNSTAHTGALYVGTATETATSFYVYYGSGNAEPAANSTYGKYAVWESTAHLVAHLEGVTDSTSYQNNGTNYSATAGITGQVENGYGFNGSQYITVGTCSGLLPSLSAGSVTFSTWINTTSTAAFASIFGIINTGATTLFVIEANRDEGDNYHAGYTSIGLRDDNGISLAGRITTNIYNGAWHHLVFVATPSANSILAYVDGSPVSVTLSGATTPNNFADAGFPIALGAYMVRGGTNNFFTGSLDEVRAYSRALSATEIAAMYANQNVPGTFWSTSAETAPSSVDRVNIYLRGGTYTQATGLTFGVPDSGTTGNPITWLAYPGEVPVISGGAAITGWTLDTGSIYKAYVGTSWDFRQLYVNGAHVQRARGPLNPTGWTRTGTGYTAPDASMAAWGNPTNIEVVSLGFWSIGRGRPATISTADGGGAAVAMSSTFWTNQQTILDAYGIRATPSWVENAYELMAPGYWYLNRTTGYLYYWPPSGSMTGVTVVAPVVANPLTITGANDLQFKGIGFAYSNWTGPDSSMGYLGEQSGNYWATYSSDLRTLDAAVTVNASTGITFTDDEFSHMSSRVVLIKGGSSNVVVTGNRFDDNAGGAIQIGDVGTTAAALQESGVIITRNLISAGNSFDYLDNSTIFAPRLTTSMISNNTIMSAPAQGIAIGWGWSATSFASNNTIANNWIYDACGNFVDCAGIYALGAQSATGAYNTGLALTNNYINGGVIAVYNDYGSSWTTITNTVCQNNDNTWLNISARAATPNIASAATYTGCSSAYDYSDYEPDIAAPLAITCGTQPFGTPAQAVICGAGVPGSTACTTPTLWPTWQSGVGATWSRPQLGP